jgi:uncharacterized protein YjbJ (UPF0337 family)
VGSVAGWLSKYVPRAFAILVAGVRTYINIYRTVVVTAFKVVRTIIGAVGSFVAGSVKFYIAYLNGVRSVLGKVVSFVKSIPGKVVAALGNLGSVLFNSGRALLEGFARGITSKVGEVYGAAKSALSKVRNLFPHSPAKEGPFSGKGWTLHSGQALMTGLADGITRSKGKVKSAIVQVLDAVKQQVQQVTSSVSQAFGGDLFSATSGVKFLQNLTTTGGTVGRSRRRSRSCSSGAGVPMHSRRCFSPATPPSSSPWPHLRRSPPRRLGSTSRCSRGCPLSAGRSPTRSIRWLRTGRCGSSTTSSVRSGRSALTSAWS